MPAQSSGLLLYRYPKGAAGSIEVLIGHMGGPFWSRKTEHCWSIPKGLHEPDETDALAVAEREFAEEMGSQAPSGPTIELGSAKSGRKLITIFARAADFDAEAAVSNTFSLEWPPRSGKMIEVPEIDQAAWVALDEAPNLLVKGQNIFLDRLASALE